MVGEGAIFTFDRLGPHDSGEYLCRAVNDLGHWNSTPVSLNVLYQPRNTQVSSPNETIEGASVNLTCSSDANPPVENYTWFKVNESTPVGSGQQYSIINIRSEDGGQYYCEARNKYGAENSTPIQLNVITDNSTVLLYILIGITVCGALTLLCAVLWIRSQKGNKGSIKHDMDQDEDLYANIGFQASTQHGAAGPQTPPSPGAAEDDAVYSNVQHHYSTETGAAADEANVQYASVQFQKFQKASVKFKKARAGQRSPAHADQEDSVIYSGVQSQHPSQLSRSCETNGEDESSTDIYSRLQKPYRK
ncbi:B-cell receptor CD22-like [Alosa sapidissima]|uniref:B-cell receptor CD22-like n=1 Tax=Alosa sapidissima TaxID=34773 RepID=UPI001C0A5A07|nr:B-cell receptor CD22-like [Alosa sapidissima]